jgi:hypothetical protein
VNKMAPIFFQHVESILHAERLGAYGRDGSDPSTVLSRYLFNLALSEALYPSLQFAEISLRNAVHRELTARCGTEAWYDCASARLMD